MRYTLKNQQSITTRRSGKLDSFTKLKEVLSTVSSFETQSEYDTFLREIVAAVKAVPDVNIGTKDIFTAEMNQRDRVIPLIEKTPWGLVSLQQVNVPKDSIRKYLVIKKHGILGFEYHKKKHERLEVLEGLSLIWWINHESSSKKNGEMEIRVAAPGDTFTFLPYDEHGLIALTNCVIEEKSTNHLDDLIFITESKQIINL